MRASAQEGLPQALASAHTESCEHGGYPRLLFFCLRKKPHWFEMNLLLAGQSIKAILKTMQSCLR